MSALWAQITLKPPSIKMLNIERRRKTLRTLITALYQQVPEMEDGKEQPIWQHLLYYQHCLGFWSSVTGILSLVPKVTLHKKRSKSHPSTTHPQTHAGGRRSRLLEIWAQFVAKAALPSIGEEIVWPAFLPWREVGFAAWTSFVGNSQSRRISSWVGRKPPNGSLL